MNTKDISLFESGSGGDFAIVNDDLLMGESLFQQIFLALFGGNIEESTKQFYLETEERFDYWGNTLLWNDVKTKQFNSETERVLRNVAVNSSGRIAILQAVELDIAYLKTVANLVSDVQILSISEIKITIVLSEKSNQQDKLLQFVYNNASGEIIIQRKYEGNTNDQGIVWQYVKRFEK